MARAVSVSFSLDYFLGQVVFFLAMSIHALNSVNIFVKPVLFSLGSVHVCVLKCPAFGTPYV